MITAEQNNPITVALTDDITSMADYVRTDAGQKAIKRGLSDIKNNRVYEGVDALAIELKQRAEVRRD
jgi:hypothetical protein